MAHYAGLLRPAAEVIKGAMVKEVKAVHFSPSTFGGLSGSSLSYDSGTRKSKAEEHFEQDSGLLKLPTEEMGKVVIGSGVGDSVVDGVLEKTEEKKKEHCGGCGGKKRVVGV